MNLFKVFTFWSKQFVQEKRLKH